MPARKRLHHSSDHFRTGAYALLNVLQPQKPLQYEVIWELHHALRKPLLIHKSESELEYTNFVRRKCGCPLTQYKGIDHGDPRKTHGFQPSVFTVRPNAPHHVCIGSRSAFLHINNDLWIDRRPNADKPFYEPREPSESGVRNLVMVPNWAEFIILLRRVCAKVHPLL
jgi:hypothetical protein